MYKPPAPAVSYYCLQSIGNLAHVGSLVNTVVLLCLFFLPEFYAILWKGDVTDNSCYSTV